MPQSNRLRWCLLIAIGILYASPALAQGAAAMVQSIPDTFLARTRMMEGTMRNYGMGLLAALLLIEGGFAIGLKWLDGGGFQDILGVFVRFGLTVGFFTWLLSNASDFARFIVDSMTMIGNAGAVAMGGSPSLSPGNLVGISMNMTSDLFAATSFYSPVQSATLIVIGLIIIWAFVDIISILIEIIVRGMIHIAVTGLMIGFGGNAYTRDIAIAQFRGALGIGAEKLVLLVIAGIGESLMRGWTVAARKGELNMEAMVPMIMAPWIIRKLVSTMPAQAAMIVNGHVAHVGYGGAASRGMGTALGAMAGTAAALGGAGALVAAAADKAAAQMQATGGGSGQAGGGTGGGSRPALGAPAGAGGAGGGGGIGGRLGTAARGVGLAAKAIGEAAAHDVGRRMTGAPGASHGHPAFRMAASMRADAKQMRGEMEAEQKAGQQQRNQSLRSRAGGVALSFGGKKNP